MAAAGVNAVRTYTVPPRWLLDLAHEHGLCRDGRAAWEQHVAFLDERGRDALDRGTVRAGVRGVRRPPAVLVLRGRQRDPGLDRPLARPPTGRALPRAPAASGQGGGSRTASSRTSTTRRPSTSSCRSSTSSASTSTSRRGEALEALPRPAPEPRRRPAAADRRDRPRQPAQRRATSRRDVARAADAQQRSRPAAPGRSSSPGPTSGTAAASTSTTGTSASSTASGGRSRRSQRRRAAFARRCRSPRGPAWPRDLGRRLHVQRRARRSAVPRGARARSTTRTTRSIVVDDGSTDDTAAIAERVRRPADPHREPRASQRARNTGLEARPARSSPTSTTTPGPTRTGSATSRTRFATSEPRRRRRAEPRRARTTARVADCVAHAPAGRRTSCSPTREAEHIPGCNMAFRRDGARGGRRLRPAVPHRRRRRRHLLAAAGARLDARLQPRRRSSGTTAAARCAATGGSSVEYGTRRGAARAQVAGEVQPRRPRLAGRAGSTARGAPRCRGAAGADRLRHLGHAASSSRSTSRAPSLIAALR